VPALVVPALPGEGGERAREKRRPGMSGSARLFFPQPDNAGADELEPRTQAACARALTLAGESATAKTGLLLQYAYNAALRGCRSLIFARQRPSPAVPRPGVSRAPLPREVAPLVCVPGRGARGAVLSRAAHGDSAASSAGCAGPLPQNEAVLAQMIAFKYVSSAADIR